MLAAVHLRALPCCACTVMQQPGDSPRAPGPNLDEPFGLPISGRCVSHLRCVTPFALMAKRQAARSPGVADPPAQQLLRPAIWDRQPADTVNWAACRLVLVFRRAQLGGDPIRNPQAPAGAKPMPASESIRDPPPAGRSRRAESHTAESWSCRAPWAAGKARLQPRSSKPATWHVESQALYASLGLFPLGRRWAARWR